MKELNKVASKYKESFRMHGNHDKAVFFPKGRQFVRYRSMLKNFKNDKKTILDYGCGLAKLRSYLKSSHPSYVYNGADIVNDFIDENSKNYPESNFKLIESYEDIDNSYDIILCSGVFNILYDFSLENHQDYVFNCIKHLFNKTNVALCVDFMHDEVDFQQDGAFHQNISKLIGFVKTHLSERYVFDRSFLPYEFSLVIYKNVVLDERGCYAEDE
ncbi:MAG: hypothetical protein COW01_04325 [Bdellovibrionales bacterium CG12_big_fil_rev_8_21_14_0_65_38_15]|nr:MAG: hypothetical protein COW01_04325 [Bdellovibrionales bacterium CG12_big_fil_rev_8_21_14_0_65_38_15]